MVPCKEVSDHEFVALKYYRFDLRSSSICKDSYSKLKMEELAD